MPQEDDLFTSLPPGSFDGIIIPVQSVQIKTGSARAFHRYPYRAGQIIEYTGRDPVSGVITAAFFNGIEEGGSNVLWPDGLQLLRRRVQEQKSGKLVIPTLGELPSASIDLDERYSHEAREGAMVSINFVEDSQDQFVALSLPSARGRLPEIAAAADNALAILNIKIKGLLDDAGDTISLSAFVANIQGNLGRLQDESTRAVAQAGALVNQLDDVIRTTRALGSPSNYAARDALLELSDSLTTAAQEVTSGVRAVRTFTVAGVSTAAQVAAATGNTVADILALNPIEDANKLDVGDSLFVYVV